MARWKLTEKHYIYTDPPTEWEHKETDLASGEEVRERYEVPRFLDPDQPMKVHGKPWEGTVCLKGKGEPGDIAIKGPPTTAMQPLDEEAQEITDRMKRGAHPIESLTPIGDAPPNILAQMQAQLNALMMANDDLHRRLTAAEKASEGDVLKDIADIASQQVPPAKGDPKPIQRRL